MRVVSRGMQRPKRVWCTPLVLFSPLGSPNTVCPNGWPELYFCRPIRQNSEVKNTNSSSWTFTVDIVCKHPVGIRSTGRKSGPSPHPILTRLDIVSNDLMRNNEGQNRDRWKKSPSLYQFLSPSLFIRLVTSINGCFHVQDWVWTDWTWLIPCKRDRLRLRGRTVYCNDSAAGRVSLGLALSDGGNWLCTTTQMNTASLSLQSPKILVSEASDRIGNRDDSRQSSVTMDGKKHVARARERETLNQIARLEMWNRGWFRFVCLFFSTQATLGYHALTGIVPVSYYVHEDRA